MNNTIPNAVSALNEQRLREVTIQAQGLIDSILEEQANKKRNNDIIADLQKSLNAMVDATATTILDRTLDPSNPAQKVFADVIAKVQKDRVEPQAVRLAREIDERKQGNVKADERIAKLRKDITELEARVVNVADVTGATA